MRAYEFIKESKKIEKISKRNQQSTKGLHKFRDKNGFDRTYELNRIMMAAACSDGVNPLDLSAESWAGRFNTAHPYTDVEANMLKSAYKALGSQYIDINNGDNKSKELDSTNKKSPMQPFKGY